MTYNRRVKRLRAGWDGICRIEGEPGERRCRIDDISMLGLGVTFTHPSPSRLPAAESPSTFLRWLSSKARSHTLRRFSGALFGPVSSSPSPPQGVTSRPPRADGRSERVLERPHRALCRLHRLPGE